MGATNNNDVNIVDPGNTTTTPLAGSATYTGDWTNVTNYSSVTVLVAADQIIANGQFEWSDDGITTRDTLTFIMGYSPSSFGGGFTAHATIRAPYYRIVITNAGTPNSIFVVNSMLRRGTPSGYVSPLILPPDAADDALTTKAVLFATDGANNVPILATPNGVLQVARPDNSNALSRQDTIANIGTSQRLDPGVFTAQRKDLYILNDTLTGNLYITLGATSSMTSYDFKVPPQHTWQVPYDWSLYTGAINGIWDTADGVARCVEMV